MILFEHKGLYRRGKHPVAWDPAYRGVWHPRRIRSGDYATLVTYGEMVHLAADVCDYLAAEYEVGHRGFRPARALARCELDEIEASVEATRRLVVLHEGRLTHGFGAELVARITEGCFRSLKAPPLRIGSLDLPVPFAPELEGAYRPTREKVIERITAWMA